MEIEKNLQIIDDILRKCIKTEFGFINNIISDAALKAAKDETKQWHFQFLIDEGMVTSHEKKIAITPKGRLKMSGDGYLLEYRKNLEKENQEKEIRKRTITRQRIERFVIWVALGLSLINGIISAIDFANGNKQQQDLQQSKPSKAISMETQYKCL